MPLSQEALACPQSERTDRMNGRCVEIKAGQSIGLRTNLVGKPRSRLSLLTISTAILLLRWTTSG
jgi:hypothetical protein